MPDATAAVELRELTKQFGNVIANAGVNLRVETGAIHGIIGENGAGKSTAMKMLQGLYRPDSGEIFVHGKKCVWTSPADAIAAGIGMVHQHFMLAGPYSALDNILLGAEPRRWGMIDRKGARARLETLARQYGLPVDWERPVEQLPVGIQQRIEILKLLYREVKILILDEPTAVLTPQETSELFGNLKKLRAEGKTILLVTHKLKEVMAFTDRVTVFRAGKVTGDVETAQTTPQELANLMVGRKVVLSVEAAPAKPRAETAIEVAGLSLSAAEDGQRAPAGGHQFFGEARGDCGHRGRGGERAIGIACRRCCIRARRAAGRGGTVKFLGEDVTGWTAAAIRNLGVAVIPEDRQHEGLLLERPVSENFLLGLQRSAAFSRAGF